MHTLGKVISRLADMGCNPKQRNGKPNAYQAKCPAHNDQNPSLSVEMGDDGKVLFHCFAGCPTDQIITGLGLSWQDVFPQTNNGKPRKAASPNKPFKLGKNVVAIYDYQDEKGEYVHSTVRFKPKKFMQGVRLKNGLFLAGLDTVEKTYLYRTPEVLKAIEQGAPVYLVEGEKDVETLEKLGFVATTQPMGAGKWKPHYTEFLRGAEVFIIPDNDPPGKQSASKIYHEIKDAVKSVNILLIPEKYKDVSDWVEGGATAQDIKTLKPSIPPEPVEKSAQMPEFWEITGDKVKIDRHKLLMFLQANGFYRFRITPAKYILVRITDNIIDEVTPVDIKNFTKDHIRSLNTSEQEKIDIENALLTGARHYFSGDQLDFLDTIQTPFVRDTQTEKYMFFKNCALRITAKDIEKIDYKDLKGVIWKKQIIQRQFEFADHEKSEFLQFLSNVSGGDDDRLKSFMSACGYLLHNYKDRTNAKAIVCVDEKIPQTDAEANGGTGKGLFCQAFKALKSYAVKDQRFKNVDRFDWQELNFDTEILFIDDVPKNFPFHNIFSAITEDLQVEKKHVPAFTIPFEQSPKIVITTNYSIQGRGASYYRRQYTLEFADYYNADFTPIDEFEHRLFDDWGKEEWLKFLNFMAFCVQYYLANGLKDVKPINAEKRKLIDATNYQFVEFAESHIQAPGQYNRDDLFDTFQKEYSDFHNDFFKKNTFTKWLTFYADFRGWKADFKRSNNQNLAFFTPKKSKKR